MDVSNNRHGYIIFHCPLSAGTLSRVFHGFLPLSSRHSGDFSRFFCCFNLLKHGWRTDSKMSGGISQPAARIMLPTSSLTSIHQVVAYYVFSPNFLVKVQQKLKKKKTCSNMFFAKRSNFLFSKCFKKKQSISLSLVTSMDGKTLHVWRCQTPCPPSFTPSPVVLGLPGRSESVDFPTCSRYSVPKTLCVDSITPNSNCWQNEVCLFFFRFFPIMFISNCWFELCPGSKTLPQQLQELRSLRCTCIACRNAAETLQITWAVSNPHLPNHVKLTVESEDSPRTSSKCNIICCHWPKGKKAAKSALKASTTLTIPPWDLKKTTQFSITYYYKYIDTWILPSRNHLRKKKKQNSCPSPSPFHLHPCLWGWY